MSVRYRGLFHAERVGVNMNGRLVRMKDGRDLSTVTAGDLKLSPFALEGLCQR
jgi:hypothetical protein